MTGEKLNQNEALGASDSRIPGDLQELKNLVGVISRGKQMWEATFDAIRDPVVIVDSQYQIVRSNLATAHQSGLPIRELIGKVCYEAFLHRTSPCPACPLHQTLREDAPHFAEIDDPTADHVFRLSSYRLLSEGGQGRKLAVHHYRNVTEEKRLQKKLIQSEKMAAIGMLAGGVAHEINNPLAGILAFTQILKRDVTDASVQEDLHEIEEAAKRCKKIVEDLLVFARPHRSEEFGLLEIDREIERILPMARLELRHENATLSTHYDKNLPPVLGSSARLQQVFLNLIHNAVQSMKGRKGGNVSIRVVFDAERKSVVVAIRDEGCGIPAEELSKIFDPFYTTKERGEGTGLGLSICYSIVSEHGGKIEVESEVENKVKQGSTFRVVLPAKTS